MADAAFRAMKTCGSVTGLVLVAVAVLGLSGGVSSVRADGQNSHAHHKPRVELSFGRTETYDYDPPEPGSYDLPPIKRAGDGTVLDPSGKTRRLSALLQDHVTVLAFIYTRCEDPEGCPMSMSLLYDIQYVKEQDPTIGDNLKLMALSFDPAHDTPEVMARYGYGDEGWAKDKEDILYLTTESEKEIKPILKAYDQAIGLKKNPDDSYGPLTHQLRVYLIDRKGWIRNVYSLGFLDPRLVLSDIRTLLLQDGAATP